VVRHMNAGIGDIVADTVTCRMFDIGFASATLVGGVMWHFPIIPYQAPLRVFGARHARAADAHEGRRRGGIDETA
jgi:hypothetical protein